MAVPGTCKTSMMIGIASCMCNTSLGACALLQRLYLCHWERHQLFVRFYVYGFVQFQKSIGVSVHTHTPE